MGLGVSHIRVLRVDVQAAAVRQARLGADDRAQLHLLEHGLQFPLNMLRIVAAGDQLDVHYVRHGKMIVVQVIPIGGALQVLVNRALPVRHITVVIDAVAIPVHRVDEIAGALQALHQPAAGGGVDVGRRQIGVLVGKHKGSRPGCFRKQCIQVLLQGSG